MLGPRTEMDLLVGDWEALAILKLGQQAMLAVNQWGNRIFKNLFKKSDFLGHILQCTKMSFTNFDEKQRLS